MYYVFSFGVSDFAMFEPVVKLSRLEVTEGEATDHHLDLTGVCVQQPLSNPEKQTWIIKSSKMALLSTDVNGTKMLAYHIKKM